MVSKHVIAAASAAAFVLIGNASQAQTNPPTIRQFDPPYYVFSPDPPHDLTANTGAQGNQPYVDSMAWDVFIALNWPAPNPLTQRGVPDRQNIIGGFYQPGEGGGKSSPVGPTVWETFKDTNDIYLDPPVKPTAFDVGESVPPACRSLAAANPVAARRTLVMKSKFDDVLRGTKQADGNRLVDQNGQDVWYEVKLNRVYYDYVVQNQFYDSRKQTGKTIAFPASSNVTAAPGTIKVKAAWKVMGPSGTKQPDDPSKFYTTQALVLDPDTGKCSQQMLGLVGLHIVMKTKTFPQWLWATFEHVANAPDQTAGPQPNMAYNFYSAACANCAVNTPPTKAQPQVPTQVMRVVPIDGLAETKNALYQAAFKTLRPDNVWQNYMLVDAQWGAKTESPSIPNQPQFLANTTLETYLQAATNPNGCINCHGAFAAKTDFDFQLKFANPQNKALLLDLLKVPGVASPR